MSTSAKNKRIKIYALGVLLVATCLFVAIPFWVFPSEEELRRSIEQATSVEVHYVPAPNYPRHLNLTTLEQGKHSALLDELAQTIQFGGIWIPRGPLIPLSGITYRIRVTCADGTKSDIKILNGTRIEYRGWTMSLEAQCAQAINRVVVRSGGEVPTWPAIQEVLRHDATTP